MTEGTGDIAMSETGRAERQGCIGRHLWPENRSLQVL